MADGAARGVLRTDKGLSVPLDALGTNLLAADVGGKRGGFELRHDGFRDALLTEARRAKYSVGKEFTFGVGENLSAGQEAMLRGAVAAADLASLAAIPAEELSERAAEEREAAKAVVDAAVRAGADAKALRACRGSALGMRVDLRLHHPAGDSKWRMYEVKSTAFCKSHYRTRWHACGRSWADWRAKAAVQERYDQAADLDVNLFKGAQPPPMASAIGRFEGGVRALVCGGCCELNTEAHALLVEMGEAMGTLSAAESKEDARQCRALEIRGVRQRVAVQIWRDYQQHINARMQYADPDSDARLRNADEVEQEAAEWQQKAERVHNEWYNQRKRRPQEFGV